MQKFTTNFFKRAKEIPRTELCETKLASIISGMTKNYGDYQESLTWIKENVKSD